MFAPPKMKNRALVWIAVGLFGPLALAERPINELPMYGGIHNPTVEEDVDYSKAAADLGWKYYSEGDLDTAIKRFNQSWMFDRGNVDALWGFGVIMGRRADEERPEYHIRESIRFLEMAVSLQTNDANLLADLGYSYAGLGSLLSKQNDALNTDAFSKALAALERAKKIDPDLPTLHSNWSVLEFCRGNYAAAQIHLDRAKELGYKPDPAYEKDLKDKNGRSEPAPDASPHQAAGDGPGNVQE